VSVLLRRAGGIEGRGWCRVSRMNWRGREVPPGAPGGRAPGHAHVNLRALTGGWTIRRLACALPALSRAVTAVRRRGRVRDRWCCCRREGRTHEQNCSELTRLGHVPPPFLGASLPMFTRARATTCCPTGRRCPDALPPGRCTDRCCRLRFRVTAAGGRRTRSRSLRESAMRKQSPPACVPWPCLSPPFKRSELLGP
jgi:hypothetical protein